jgi:hypothetical protein
LRDLSYALARLDEGNETLNAAIADAHAQQRLNDEAVQRFDKAQKLVARHGASLKRNRDALRRVSAAAGVEPVPDIVARTILQVSDRLTALVDSQPDVSAAPKILALLNDLRRSLGSALTSDLGDRVLLDRDPAHAAWTVAALDEACRSQIVWLTEQSRGADAELLATEIAAVRNRLDALAKVENNLRSSERVERWLGQAEEELAEATANLAANPGDQISQLLRERNEREKEGRELQSRIDRLNLELELLSGGKTEEALSAELEAICRTAGIEVSRIRGSLERERKNLSSLLQEEAEAHMVDGSETHALSERLSQLDQTAESLATSAEFAWLRAARPEVSQLQALDVDERLALIDDLAKHVSRASEMLRPIVDSVRGISGAFDELAKLLLGSSAAPKRPQDWTDPVHQWLSEQVRQWFDDDIMREILFSGGRDIRLDPSDLTVSWWVDGEENKRPLTIFSSGEQAFAFTRARVAQLDRIVDVAANRLIALDEFGAYLDAERLRGLAEFLTQREQHTPRDQVLVILPYRLVPADGPGTSRIPAEHEAELARRGYFAEPFRA